MLPIEEAIVEKLKTNGLCCLDDVVASLPSYSWGGVFAAVDRMSRDGRVLLRQHSYSTYHLSLGSRYAREGDSSK
jgi:hypothetical protein